MIRQQQNPNTPLTALQKVLAGVGVLTLLVAAGLVIGAILEAWNKPQRLELPQKVSDKRVGRVVQRDFLRLQQALNLSYDQKKKLADILEKAALENAAIENKEYANVVEKIMTIRRARWAVDKEIEAILTPEQVETFRAIRLAQQQAVDNLIRLTFTRAQESASEAP
jgi:hypothetical protein